MGFYGRRMVSEPLLKLLKKLDDAGVTDEDLAALAGLATELAGKQDELTAGSGINIAADNTISYTVSPVHVTKVIIHAFDGTKDYYVTGVVYTSTVLNEPDVDDMLRLFQSQKTGLFVQDGQTEVYNGLYLNDYGDNYMEFSTYGDEAYVNITTEEEEFDYSVDRYYHII